MHGCMRPTRSRQLSPQSFGFVLAQEIVSNVSCESGEDCGSRNTSGSGVVIGNVDKKTIVLSAGHVCAPEASGKMAMLVVDAGGEAHEVIDVKFSKSPDLCVITTKDTWGKPARITNRKVKYGESVKTLAAPHGIYMPNVVLIMEGMYAGQDDMSNVYYTVPAAPGSSGSAIFNDRGEIVSIVHSATKNFASVAIGTNPENIKKFLQICGHADLI
jgi:hypothetical protein